jgi:hypothetical protein
MSTAAAATAIATKLKLYGFPFSQPFRAGMDSTATSYSGVLCMLPTSKPYDDIERTMRHPQEPRQTSTIPKFGRDYDQQQQQQQQQRPSTYYCYNKSNATNLPALESNRW